MTSDFLAQESGRTKRVTILNVWGTNRGDEAMQRALVAGLLDTTPDLEIAIFAQSAVELPIEVRCYTWNDLPLLSIPATRYQLVNYVRKLADRSTPTVKSRAAANAFLHSSDLIISGPAGPYIGDAYPEYEASCLANINFAYKHNIPCVITATSAGPFNSVIKNRQRRRILETVKWWTIRESLSYQAVEEFAPPKLQYELVADLVFSRHVTLDSVFQSNYEQQELEALLRFTNSPTIGITLNTTVYIDNNAQRHYFDLTRYTEDMVSFLRDVVSLTGAQLLFFPHHYGTLQEMQLIKNIASALGNVTPVMIVAPYLNSDCQQALISRLATYISHRYHPTIFALQQAVPVFCITHQFKANGLLQQFDYPVEMPNTLTPLKLWYGMFEKLWTQRAEIKSHIESKLPLVRQMACRTIERLSETVRSL